MLSSLRRTPGAALLDLWQPHYAVSPFGGAGASTPISYSGLSNRRSDDPAQEDGVPPVPLRSPPMELLIVSPDADWSVDLLAMLERVETFGPLQSRQVAVYEEALEAVRRRRIDICLFDDRLGPGDGIRFVREEEVGFGGIPIILFGVENHPDREKEAVFAGATDYLGRSGLTQEILSRVLLHAWRVRQMTRRVWEREQQLHSIVQAFDGYIFICDKDHRITYMNERLLSRTGRSALGEECFRVLNDFASPCPWCDPFNDIPPATRTSRIEIRSPKDGRWYLVNTTPLEQANGEMGRLSLLQDITERKQAELDLQEMNESLERRVAERTLALEKAYAELKAQQAQILQQEKMASIGVLAAGVAHEINNPMGFISSNLTSLDKYCRRLTDFVAAQSRLIRDTGSTAAISELDSLGTSLKIDYISADIRDLIGESLEGTDRVKKIVQALKTFSRKDESEYRETDVNDCIENTLNVVWNELKYKTTVEKEYGDIPSILGYPHQLCQVFLNLLLNAVQAIEGQGTIRIRTYREGDAVGITISDTGCGVPQENIDKLFEPFFTTKEVGKGTGLGLSICYEIIKKHGGTIRVESTGGEGTTFFLTLPLKEEG